MLTVRCSNNRYAPDAWYSIYDRSTSMFVLQKFVEFNDGKESEEYCKAITEMWQMLYPTYNNLRKDIFILI
jgi:hypothetical protein